MTLPMTLVRPRDLPSLVAGVRAVAGEAVLVMIEAGLEPIDEAAMLAALSPLALERAPGQRVNALVVAEGAVPESVTAAERYLAGAVAVTGQVLRIG